MKIFLALIAVSAFAQGPSGASAPFVKQFYTTNGGQPAAGYKLCTYVTGTSTPLLTYSNATLGTPNANPIVLDAAGRPPTAIFLQPLTYKFSLLLPTSATQNCTTGTMSAVWTYDPVADIGQLLRAGLAGSGGAALIGYKYSDTATLRTVQSRLRDTASALDFGCDNTGILDSTACQTALWAASAGKHVIFPPGTYYCNNVGQASSFSVLAASVDATGATFTGCRFTTASATAGLNWNGGYFDNSAYPFSVSHGGPIWQVSQDHTKLTNVRFNFEKNYTAIQFGGGVGRDCVDDVVLDQIVTRTAGASHLTATCITNARVSNWELDGYAPPAGLNLDDGFAIFGLTGTSHDITITNVTAARTYDILKITNNVFAVYNVTMTNFTCDQCVAPIYLQGGFTGTLVPMHDISVSSGVITDANGVNLSNAVLITSSGGANMYNISLSDIQASGRMNSASATSGWIRLVGVGGGVVDNLSFNNMTFTGAASGGGVFPTVVAYGQSDAAWTRIKFNKLSSNGGSFGCLSLAAVLSSVPSDMTVSNSTFKDCNTNSPTLAAHAVYNRAVWTNNTTALAANQPELESASTLYPIGVTYSEITGTPYAKAAAGTTLYCYDCAPTNPVTSQSAALGGSDCTKTPTAGVWNCLKAPALTVVNNTAWTPVLLFGGAATGITYSTQSGTYAQIGNQVTITVNLVLTSKGSATGTATISGLPVVGATAISFISGPVFASGITLISPITTVARILGSQITLNAVNLTGSGLGVLTDVAFSNVSTLSFSITYHIQ